MRAWIRRLAARLGFDTMERACFDFSYYSPLRDQGLTHREAIRELDRLWREYEVSP